MTAPAARVAVMERRLRDALQPVALSIVDQSHLHAGHAGAADGRGHFSVDIVSERFTGLTTVRRHRLVYEAVGDLMQTDIHALSIRAVTSAEDSNG